MRIAVLGGANIDLLGRSAERALPGDSNPGAVRISCGGVGRNIGENLARLGAETALLSAVGDDWAGELLLRESGAAGMDVSAVLRVPGGATGAYLAAEDRDGELLAAVNDMGVLRAVTPEYLSARADLLDRADALVLDANLPAETLCYLAERWGEKPLFADPVSAPKAGKLRPLLPRLRALKPNRAELALLSGETDVARGMAALRARGVGAVCVSLGAAGSRLLADGGAAEVSAPRVSVRDVTGAGDALFAGLIFALLRGAGPEDALRFGTAAAALTLQYDGAVRPDLTAAAVQDAVKEYFQ